MVDQKITCGVHGKDCDWNPKQPHSFIGLKLSRPEISEADEKVSRQP
jgi:hypothetical protein